MKKIIFSCLLLSSFDASTQTSAGGRLLFQNIKSKLTGAQKDSIFQLTGFLISADGKQFITDKESAEYPFGAAVYPTDLNKDSKEEIFILYGNSFTSGSTGSSVVLFLQNTKGKYVSQLGFPAALPLVIVTTGTKYPELILGGPGFEYPVWKWNGKNYAYNRTIKEAALIKLKTESVEDVSKKYTTALK